MKKTLGNYPTYRQYVELLETLEKKDSWQAIIPTLIICLGGFGGDVGRTVKWLTNKFGKSQLVEFLYIDTDASEQGAKGHLPGFSEDEFLHASMEMLAVVLNHPERHKAISDRLGLWNDEARTVLQQVVAGDPGQAGQLAMLGCLASLLLANPIRQQVSSKIGNLRARFRQLDLPSDLRVKIADRVNVVMISSSFGGTGSGMTLDVAAIVRDELEGKANFDLALYTITNEVYDRELSGYPDEANRCRANQYRFFHEMDAAETGWLYRNKIRVGGMEQSDFVCPPKLCNHIFVMQRVDASGRDFQNREALADSAAIHIAVDICTPVGAMFDRPERNSMIAQGRKIDADSRARCYLGTIAATSLGYDARKLLQYNTVRQLREFLVRFAIGKEVSPADIDEAVEIFLQENELEERSRHNADYVNDRLRQRALTNSPSTYVRPLFRAVNGAVRDYFNDGQFPTVLAETRQKFDSIRMDQFRSALTEARAEIVKLAEVAVDEAMSRMVTDQGPQAAQDFSIGLEAALRESREELQSEATDKTRAAERAGKSAMDAAVEIGDHWFAGMRCHKDLHDRAALQLRDYVQHCMEAEIRIAAAAVMQLLAGKTGIWVQRLTGAVKAARARVAELDIERNRLRSRSQTKTTSLSSELDCATPEFLAEFYRANRVENQAILEKIVSVTGKDLVETILSLATDAKMVDLENRLVGDTWRSRIAKLDIATVLEHLLTRQKGGERYLKLLLTEMISHAWPMWKATPNRASTQFGDTLVLGIPESVSGGNQNRLKALIEEAMSSAGRSALYQAQVVTCPTSMSDRIVCVRRSHGARPDWLAGWSECRRAMEAWMKAPPHPIYTFNPDIVARMPRVEPIEDADRGELAFAIALPLGLVAVRGNTYVHNLRVTGTNGTLRRTVPWSSHADGFAFRDGKFDPQPLVQQMIDAGELVYERTDSFDSDDRFAQGRERAMETFAADSEAVDAVMAVFDRLHELAGKTGLISGLETYIEDLRRSCGPKSSLHDQINKETTLLRQQIDNLQNGQ